MSTPRCKPAGGLKVKVKLKKLGGDTKKMKTQIFAFALVIVVATAVFGATFAPAMADTEGQSEGSFDLGNDNPVVINVALYESDESTSATSMSPETGEYALKIEVSDANSLNDIDQISVWIKQDSYSGSNDVRYLSTMTWTSSGWSYDGPGNDADVSWDLVTGDGKSRSADDLTGTSGTWWLHFTPGKYAVEGTSNWRIDVTVDDGTTTDTGNVAGISMQSYIEITADQTSYSFGSVSLSDTEKPITETDESAADHIAVSTRANGNYRLDSFTDGSWTGQTTSGTATVNPGATLGNGEIRLTNNAEGISGSYAAGSKVSTTAGTITGYTTVDGPASLGGGQATSEPADTKDIYQWLDVASAGLLPDEFQGTYTVQIVAV